MNGLKVVSWKKQCVMYLYRTGSEYFTQHFRILQNATLYRLIVQATPLPGIFDPPFVVTYSKFLLLKYSDDAELDFYLELTT